MSLKTRIFRNKWLSHQTGINFISLRATRIRPICRIVVNGFFVLTLRISIPESDMSVLVFIETIFLSKFVYL